MVTGIKAAAETIVETDPAQRSLRSRLPSCTAVSAVYRANGRRMLPANPFGCKLTGAMITKFERHLRINIAKMVNFRLFAAGRRPMYAAKGQLFVDF